MYLNGKPQVRQISKDEMRQYGESFKLMREYAGIQMKEMASMLKVSLYTYKRWEEGKVIPQIEIDELEWQIKCIVKSYILSNEYLKKQYEVVNELMSS